MSSSSSSPLPPAAPWRDPFTTHLSSLQPPIVFTLSTLHPVPHSLTPADGIPVLPRARTCVFRGFFGSLPPNNGRNPAPLNPPIYTSDMLTFTTDARTSKVSDIFDTASSPLPGPSGGGGPVEAVFWVEEAKTQWRIRGNAWVLGADIDSDGEGARKVREVLLERMRKSGEGRGEKGGDEQEEGKKEWSFAKEVTAHFGNLSPVMRGSFKGPEPGKPMDYGRGEGEGELGGRLEDLEDEVARRHFRVVVVVPGEVDRVDLREETRPRRWLYTFRGEGGGEEGAKLPGGEMEGGWEVTELWP
ncbi:pyridoxamine 5'-phosphate oxidase-domain-containing protein [Apiosordaria backusii]|uniref:Pyridoxamine 5'-phosphate oxidase-domain-containing protein n=1 Tax=Apiosordaria backusii TaxID=314023 RepID=A0AA40EMT9_9PEZI|nr:pyridoxamine 5'-phosphate oxidase-domain-containing protein [Apiosordaria backusii]